MTKSRSDRPGSGSGAKPVTVSRRRRQSRHSLPGPSLEPTDEEIQPLGADPPVGELGPDREARGAGNDAPDGRPSYPPLLMVKVLLLEQWDNLSDPQLSDPQLSDPQMEEALGNRISSRRFVGLGRQEDAPDHSTVTRFSAALAGRGEVRGPLYCR